jgi:hypothetical protein
MAINDILDRMPWPVRHRRQGQALYYSRAEQNAMILCGLCAQPENDHKASDGS